MGKAAACNRLKLAGPVLQRGSPAYHWCAHGLWAPGVLPCPKGRRASLGLPLLFLEPFKNEKLNQLFQLEKVPPAA